MTAIRSRARSRARPRTWLGAWRDRAVVLAAFALCPLVAALAPDAPAGPLANARDLVGAERALGVGVEPDLIAWGQQHPAVLSVALSFYLWAHVPATVGVMVWAWLERPRAFRLVRNTFVTTQLVVVAGYLAWPTAPPRLTFDVSRGLDPATEAATSVVQSPYAAMPSGHVAFAVFVAWVLVRLSGRWWIGALALAYPVGVTVVTLITANHFVLDVAAGALATGAGALVARRCDRLS